MQFSQNETTILLICDDISRQNETIQALHKAGHNVLTAKGGREGFRLLRRERPDLIICDASLSDISALELCRMIRADREFCAMPFMLFSETAQSDDSIVEAFHAGADEFLTEFVNPKQLAAKIVWVFERKNSEESLRRYYQILRDRQFQIAGIIKGVSGLFTTSDFQLKTSRIGEERGAELDKRIDLGISMIGALANLLDEQVKALDAGERSLRGEIFVVKQSQPQITYDLAID
jgi:DNA-binding response OmpR family regulator